MKQRILKIEKKMKQIQKNTEKRNSSEKSVAEKTSSTNSKDKCTQKSEAEIRLEK